MRTTLYAYGATEVGTTCSISSQEWMEHPGSVGRPLPPFSVLVVDDDDNEVPAGTEGRLYFVDSTGRGIVYPNDPEKTAKAHLRPDMVVADVGAGTGFLTDALAPLVQRVYALDGSPAMLEIAKKNLAQYQNVIFEPADGLALPFADQSFDRILVSDVVEHLEARDVPRLLGEIHRVCRAGGSVVIFTSCRGLRLRPLLLRLRGLRGRGELDWKDLQDGHRNRFTGGALGALVRKAGFSVRRRRFFSHCFSSSPRSQPSPPGLSPRAGRARGPARRRAGA